MLWQKHKEELANSHAIDPEATLEKMEGFNYLCSHWSAAILEVANGSGREVDTSQYFSAA